MTGMANDRRPPQWRRRPPWRQASALVLLGLATVLTASMGLLAAVRGDARAVLLLAGTPLLAAVTAWGAGTRLPRWRGGADRLRSTDRDGRPALVFPYARWLGAVAVAGLAVLMLFFAAGAVTAAAAGSVAAVPLAIFAAALVPLLAGIATGRLQRGEVALDPTGVRHRSWAFTTYTPWTAIHGVRAEHADGPLILITTTGSTGSTVVERRTRLWRQPEMAFLPHLAIRGAYLACDPTLLLDALTHYVTHHGDRPKLAGPQATTHLTDGATGAGGGRGRRGRRGGGRGWGRGRR